MILHFVFGVLAAASITWFIKTAFSVGWTVACKIRSVLPVSNFFLLAVAIGLLAAMYKMYQDTELRALG